MRVFQEEGWPTGILNPLAARPQHDARERLHDVIIRLNRGQEQQLLRFLADGTGEGICWEVSASGLEASTPDRH